MKNTLETLSSGSLGDKVFEILEQQILNGTYAAGDQLVESKISAELGVSRTPVREALRQLELDNLVTTIQNKGTFVVGISTDDIKDIYTIRIAIEGICAMWAAERITPEQARELENLVELQEFYSAKNEILQIVQLDTKFHEIIYDISGSRTLRNTLHSFHVHVKRARESSFFSAGRTKAAVEEHRELFEAISSKNGQLAKTLMEKHITNARDNILSIIESK
jgi:DNA-binding GntR family transcriptional regulator